MKAIYLILLTVCVVFAEANTNLHLPIDRFDPRLRIIGGQRAVIGQFPYQAELRTTAERRHMCGASILNDRFLLTAAHCTQFEYSKPENLYAVVGTIFPRKDGAIYKLDKITLHEGWDSNRIIHDICLIRTVKRIAFSDIVQPIALPTKDTRANVTAVVSGWGRTENDSPEYWTNYLKYAVTKTIRLADCIELHKPYKAENRIYETHVCTVSKMGDGSCNGDSGGPLADVSDPDHKTLIGIVSWGMPPCGETPQVFTRVFSYLNWIQEKVMEQNVNFE